jgi:hypothetical protein
MFCDYTVYIGDIERTIADPFTVIPEAIYRGYPFFEGGAFRFRLRAVLSFGFQHKGFAVYQFHEKIRVIAVRDSFKAIPDGKVKAIVFGESCYPRVFFQFVGFGGFPSTVINAMAYVGFFEGFPGF